MNREAMISQLAVWHRRSKALLPDIGATRRWFAMASLLIVCVLTVLRFSYLAADFPNGSPWLDDQAKFTDEGWYTSAAVNYHMLGHWYVPGDFNPGVALPVWPALVNLVFHFTGGSVVAARALNVAISIATLCVVFVLVRRYASGQSSFPAMLSALLLAASPFAYAFSRLAILETLVIFEFCLLLLIASLASKGRVWPLAALPVLVAAMILTKTTSAALLPALLFVTWKAMGARPAALLRAAAAVGAVPAALLAGYVALVTKLDYGADFKFFFDSNATPSMAWGQFFPALQDLLHNGFWVDRVLYPVGLAILALSVAWMRTLWRNPLFVACWLALAGQASYIFSRQDNYAPRYYLPMLAPLVIVVVLAFAELAIRHKKLVALLLVAMVISVVANVTMIVQFVQHRQYQLRDAAASIGNIVRSDSAQKQLILGVSGSQLSLMIGIPSISDYYGTQDIPEKVEANQPGWFLIWDSIDPESGPFLAPYRLEEVASYPVFDNDDRSRLILYKMVRRASALPHG